MITEEDLICKLVIGRQVFPEEHLLIAKPTYINISVGGLPGCIVERRAATRESEKSADRLWLILLSDPKQTECICRCFFCNFFK